MYMYKSCIYLCTSTYKKTLLICTSLRLEFCPARWFSWNSCVARSLCETTIKTQSNPVWRKVSWSIKVDRTCWPRRILKKQIPSGWWLSHPSEKYESQLGWLFPINIRKHKKRSNHQPAILSKLIWHPTCAYHHPWLKLFPSTMTSHVFLHCNQVATPTKAPHSPGRSNKPAMLWNQLHGVWQPQRPWDPAITPAITDESW